jgi:hypothetical protein
MGLEKLQPIKAKSIAAAGAGKCAKAQGGHVVSLRGKCLQGPHIAYYSLL